MNLKPWLIHYHRQGFYVTILGPIWDELTEHGWAGCFFCLPSLVYMSVIPRFLWWHKYLPGSGVLDNVDQPSQISYDAFPTESLLLCSSNSKATCSLFSKMVFLCLVRVPDHLGISHRSDYVDTLQSYSIRISLCWDHLERFEQIFLIILTYTKFFKVILDYILIHNLKYLFTMLFPRGHLPTF